MILNTENASRRVVILGANGYIGVPLTKYLTEKGFFVLGIDNEMRERNVINVGSASLTFNKKPADFKIDVSLSYKPLFEIIQGLRPEAVINLAQQPSAPFSMSSADRAADTQRNNICGALNLYWAVKEASPDTHIIQLGTAGEYSDWLYDGIEIPEGSRVTVKYQDKDWTIPTPRYFGSWYHASKLYSAYNADYASRIWGLRITDINQGIVYGYVDGTRFDYDEYFGTIVNRFVTQAVAGIPLTVYGKGGQTRGFINLRNCLEAIHLLIENPAKVGEYRIIHQLTETYTVSQIAEMVSKLTGATIEHIEDPRVEMEENKFNFEAQKLKTLGLKTITMESEIPELLKVVEAHKDKINKEVIMPKHSWK